MVIENLNKYSEEQIASLQEKENVIRLIISEQPNRCNLEHLRKYAIKSDTNTTFSSAYVPKTTILLNLTFLSVWLKRLLI